ncbi:MAG: ATP-binding protein [Myxococcota bacterium]
MRWLAVPMVVALMMAGGATWLHGRDVAWHTFSKDPAAAATRIKSGFQSAHRAELSLTLADLPHGERAEVLIAPGAVLPRAHAYSPLVLRALLTYSRTCAPHSDVDRRGLEKAWTWHEYLCGQRDALPDNFFDEEPLVHPLGQSFAHRAFRTSRSPFVDEAWLAAHLRHFHALELGALPSSLLPPGLRVLAAMEPGQLSSLVESAPLILTRGHVLLRTPSVAAGEQGASYDVYPRAAWDSFVSQYDLIARERRPGVVCFSSEGRICWSPNEARLELRSRAAAGLGAGAAVMLLGSVVFLAVRRAAAQRQQRKERMLILQTLTHELRTPATSLQLSLEAFRPGFDTLTDEQQTAFLRMCDEVQRLNRVIAGSAQYLGSASVRRTLAPSIHEVLRQVLSPYDEHVTLTLPTTDGAFPLDTHWLTLCVRNLVDNALAHGQAPVTVVVERARNSLAIHVRDEGPGPAESLEQLQQAFYKGERSRGLGLGLSIVATVAEAMGGTLKLSKQPTTFTLELREDA